MKRSLAEGLYTLWSDRRMAERLGVSGFDAVRREYSIARSADRLLAVYESLVPAASHQAALASGGSR